MTIFFRILFALVVFVGGALTLPAQQEGAVAIAEKIPEVGNTVSDFVGCVEKLVAINIPHKDAMNNCLKATGKQTKIASDISDDASGATKASRPVVVMNPYWGGGYGRYYGNRWGSFTISSSSRGRVYNRVPSRRYNKR